MGNRCIPQSLRRTSCVPGLNLDAWSRTAAGRASVLCLFQVLFFLPEVAFCLFLPPRLSCRKSCSCHDLRVLLCPRFEGPDPLLLSSVSTCGILTCSVAAVSTALHMCSCKQDLHLTHWLSHTSHTHNTCVVVEEEERLA